MGAGDDVRDQISSTEMAMVRADERIARSKTGLHVTGCRPTSKGRAGRTRRTTDGGHRRHVIPNGEAGNDLERSLSSHRARGAGDLVTGADSAPIETAARTGTTSSSLSPTTPSTTTGPTNMSRRLHRAVGWVCFLYAEDGQRTCTSAVCDSPGRRRRLHRCRHSRQQVASRHSIR